MVSVASVTTTSRWIGHRDRAADARAGAEGDVDGAEDLLVLEDVAGQPRALVGADAELGEVGALLAGAREQLVEALALGPGGLRRGGRPRRSGAPGGPGRGRCEASERVATVPSPPAGAMKPSPHGRLPNAPGAVRSPSSAMPSRPREVEAQVGAARAGDVRLVGGARAGRRPPGCARAGASKSTAISRASMSAVTPGMRGAARAVVGRALARLRVRERARRSGAMKTSQAASAAAIGGGGSTPWFSRADMTASTASACAAWASRRSASPTSCSGSSTTTSTSSPGATARQLRTTVRTARASPVIFRTLLGERLAAADGQRRSPPCRG